jgi:hypothetical protein
MHAVRASARYSRAIQAVAELLTRLKIDAMFVGGVARSAWLNVEMGGGAVDVIALMTVQQRNQLAMMASHRGFRVERTELEQAEELDLVPLNFLDAEGEVRVHVLLASNALYGRMVAAAIPTVLAASQPAAEATADLPLKIPRAEDLALMLLMAEDQEALQYLTSLPEFDLPAFRERLTSIGLGGAVTV